MNLETGSPQISPKNPSPAGKEPSIEVYQKEEFYNKHLTQVSRSFAFCIEQLDQPERSYVGNSYLICRILDTIEDSPWPNEFERTQAFEAFEFFLIEPQKQSLFNLWLKLFDRVEIKESERALLQEAYKVFADLHAFPQPIFKSICTQVLTMSKGMQKFAKKHIQGEFRLANLKEVNQYCFYVAGVVGELLTNIFTFRYKQWSQVNLLNAYHFGLFLQKVNLLKDQLGDESEGRYLVPQREELFNSVKINALGAFKYLESIPLELKNYRLFCAWSLYIGLSSLPVIQSGFKKNITKKLPRTKTLLLIQQLKSKIGDPEALEKTFRKLLAKAQFSEFNKFAEPEEFSGAPVPFYKGGLKTSQFIVLGL